MILPTSSVVNAPEAMNGKKRESASPLMPPTVVGLKAEVCAPRMGKAASTMPGRFAKGIVVGVKTFVTLTKGRRMPSMREAWFWASEAAVSNFVEGEVLERRPAQ